MLTRSSVVGENRVALYAEAWFVAERGGVRDLGADTAMPVATNRDDDRSEASGRSMAGSEERASSGSELAIHNCRRPCQIASDVPVSSLVVTY